MNQRSLLLSADGEVRLEAPLDRATAFRGLSDDHLDDAYRLASVILGDRTEAEDATHDAVERAWRSFSSLRSPDAFGAWFQRILVNVCRDRLRRRKPNLRLDAVEPSSLDRIESQLGASQVDAFAGTAERDALERALARLDADQRIVIAMRFFLDLQVEEIARRLGAPPGTVKSRLHRGIRELRAAYDAVARSDPR